MLLPIRRRAGYVSWVDLQFGDVQVQIVSGGRLRLDGGSMFGVVPRVVWQRQWPPDDRHRILLDTNCLLLRTAGQMALVDSGYGAESSAAQRDHHALEDGHPLVRNLGRLGIDPADINVVIATHLHFDHAGGFTVKTESDGWRPTFPHARYCVQRVEWEDAVSDLGELSGMYSPDHLIPLQNADVLQLLDEDTELLPGVRCRLTGGHSRGHQILYLGSDDDQAVCIADLCPTRAHLKTNWTMAYDQYSRRVRRIKPQLLAEAADRGWTVLFSHDPHAPAARLVRNASGQIEISETIGSTGP